MRAHRYNCDGSGKRTSPTGSTAFPEVQCPNCDFYASPVRKPFDEWTIRAHRPLHDPEMHKDEPVSSARIFIGRSRTGSFWHLVPKPGTAFPVSACGTWIDRRTMRAADGLPARRCTRCAKQETGA